MKVTRKIKGIAGAANDEGGFDLIAFMHSALLFCFSFENLH